MPRDASLRNRAPDSVNRRTLLRATIAAGLAIPIGLSGNRTARSADTAALSLNVAGYDYDRVRAIATGAAGIERASVSFHAESIYGTSVSAFGPERKYEVTEIGLVPFVRKYVNEDFRAYTLIPVFISRIFRHRNIFVRAGSGIEKPEDLRGKTIGTPGYAFSANTWIRGFLLDQHGVAADDMQWIETTASSDGMPMQQTLDRHFLPDDFPLQKGPPGIDESELLIRGDCDALITAITPKAFLTGDPRIRRLFPDIRAAEQTYYRNTGVFPVMHAIAIRTDAIEAHPWLPKAVFDMYSKAKRIAYDNLETTTALNVSLPWVTQEFEDTRRLMGPNYWPYGIHANRRELDLVMRYVYEQGLTRREISYESLFHESTLELIDTSS